MTRALLCPSCCEAAEQVGDVTQEVTAPVAQEVESPESACECCTGGDGVVLLQVVLPEGMAGESIHSAAGLQILAGELLVNERTVEQVRLPQLCQVPLVNEMCICMDVQPVTFVGDNATLSRFTYKSLMRL